MDPTRASGRLFRFGLFKLDEASGELLRNGHRVRLQDQPLRVLTLLLERPSQLITRQELQKTLWPADTFVDFEDGLNAAVKKLRFALGDSADNPRFIETVPRRGYRFIAPVSVELASPLPHSAPLEGAAAATPEGSPRLRPQVVAGLAAVVIVSLAAAAWITWGRSSPPPAAELDGGPIRSLVVLPLKNLSDDPEQQYFADGMTEELITRLAALEGLRVISHTTAMRFRSSDKSLSEIGKELNVDAVVEGSVMRAGDRVRITAQLIHAGSDANLWAESYERDERDVFALQNEVARDIARKIDLELKYPGASLARLDRPIDPEAHRAYLRGRYRWHTRRGADLLKALEDFQRAIEVDDEYALAYAGLADTYLVLPFLTRTTQEEAYPKAKVAAERALALDPSLAEAHNSNAYVKMYLDWDFAAAERGFRRAIELNPNYATAHQWYAELLSYQARWDEALAEIRIALELDPLAAVMHHQAGQVLQQARRYEEAIQEYETAIALDPQFVGPSGNSTAWAYARMGMLEPAAEALKSVMGGSTEGRRITSEMARAAANGDVQAFRLLQLETAELYSRPACLRATFNAGLGRDDEALRWLNEAIEQRAECVLSINVDPEWDQLRSDPRFVAALRRIRLIPESPGAKG